MWDEEDGFFYDVLRAAGRQCTTRLKVRSLVGLLPLCAVDGLRRGTCGEAARSFSERVTWFIETPARAGRATSIDPRTPGRRRPPPAVAARRGQAAAGAGAHARRERVPGPATASARCRATTSTIRTCSSCGGERPSVGLPAGRVGQRDVRRQLELARPGLAPGQRPARPRAGQLYAYYGGLQGRVPDRLGPAHDPLRGRAQDLRPPRPIFRATNEAAGRSTAAQKFSDDPLWRDHVLFYEYFHGDNGAGSAPATRRGGPASSPRLLHYFATVPPAQALELWSPRRAARHATKASARLRKAGGRTLAMMMDSSG